MTRYKIGLLVLIFAYLPLLARFAKTAYAHPPYRDDAGWQCSPDSGIYLPENEFHNTAQGVALGRAFHRQVPNPRIFVSPWPSNEKILLWADGGVFTFVDGGPLGEDCPKIPRR